MKHCASPLLKYKSSSDFPITLNRTLLLCWVTDQPFLDYNRSYAKTLPRNMCICRCSHTTPLDAIPRRVHQYLGSIFKNRGLQDWVLTSQHGTCSRPFMIDLLHTFSCSNSSYYDAEDILNLQQLCFDYHVLWYLLLASLLLLKTWNMPEIHLVLNFYAAATAKELWKVSRQKVKALGKPWVILTHPSNLAQISSRKP